MQRGQRSRSDQYHDKDKAEDMKVLHSIGIRARTRTLDECVSNICDFIFDHLHSVGRDQLACASDLWRRRRRDRYRLDHRLRSLGRLRCRDGADRFSLSNGGRALSLGINPRKPLHRLADGVAQSSSDLSQFSARSMSARGISSAVRLALIRQIHQNEVIFLAVITGLQAIVNHFGIRLTAKLTDLSGYLIFVTALALTVGCVIVAAPHLEFSRLWTFTSYRANPLMRRSGHSRISLFRVFLLGLLLPIYTITGYDASAHTSEETKRAAHAVPRGMISAIVWSSLAGWVMLCAFVLMLPSMDEAAQQGWNVFFWGINTQMNSTFRNRNLYRDLRVAMALRPCNSDIRLAHDLRLLP